MVNVVLMLCLFVSYNAVSMGNDKVLSIGLAEDADHKAVTPNETTPQDDEEQSLKVSIINQGDRGVRVGFCAYLPDNIEVNSFAMEHEDIFVYNQRTTPKHAEETLDRANKEKRNAPVFVLKSLTSKLREVQTTQDNVNIRPHHEVTFQLLYSKAPFNLTNKNANQAHVSLDVSSADPFQLLGKISSPNYPSAYPNNAHFTWSLRASYGSAVSISFTDYSIESCCDRLTLHDGASSRGHIIAEIAGEYSDASEVSYSSSNNFMFLQLTSDSMIESRGFSAVFIALCIPKVFTTPSTEFSSTTLSASSAVSSADSTTSESVENSTNSNTSPVSLTLTTGSPAITSPAYLQTTSTIQSTRKSSTSSITTFLSTEPATSTKTSSVTTDPDLALETTTPTTTMLPKTVATTTNTSPLSSTAHISSTSPPQSLTNSSTISTTTVSTSFSTKPAKTARTSTIVTLTDKTADTSTVPTTTDRIPALSEALTSITNQANEETTTGASVSQYHSHTKVWVYFTVLLQILNLFWTSK